jgi:hypothetical protein
MDRYDNHPISGGTLKLVLYVVLFVMTYYYWPIRFYREDGGISSRVLVSVILAVGFLLVTLQVPTGGWANWLRVYYRRNVRGYYERLSLDPTTQSLERSLETYFGAHIGYNVETINRKVVLFIRVSGWLGNRHTALLIVDGAESICGSEQSKAHRLRWKVFPHFSLFPSKSPLPGFRRWVDEVELVQAEMDWDMYEERSDRSSLVVTPEQCLKLVDMFTNKDGTLRPFGDILLEPLKLRKVS